MNSVSSPRALPGRAASLALILILTLIPRLAELPRVREANLSPDAAHFLNVARCFERGQGFSNPSAWPAWTNPSRLPMPETFKEPGYSWLIAAASRYGADPFRAGQMISLIAGILLPLVIAALALEISGDGLIALLAALIAAGSPLLCDKSVSVLVESLFALAIALTFLATAWRWRDPVRSRRGLLLDLLTGALFGASYLLRAQAVLALPALLVLIAHGRARGRVLLGFGGAAIAALAVMSPLLLRNLRLFGTPFYSDVTAYGLWPYVDHITFSNGLDRPGSPIAFAIAHPAAVAAHMLWSLRQFATWALPRELYGDPLWMLALIAALTQVWPRRAEWTFAVLYAAVTLALILAVHWDTYYFTSSMSAWCLLAAAGAAWIARALDRRFGARRFVTLAVLIAALGPLAVAVFRPSRLPGTLTSEAAAAEREAPFLRARLAPDEAVMVNITSYWAWFTDRPAVHIVVADSARFMATVRRLKVRWAAIPSAEIPDLKAHYPERRLPPALVLDHVDAAEGISMFRVMVPDGAGSPTSGPGRQPVPPSRSP